MNFIRIKSGSVINIDRIRCITQEIWGDNNDRLWRVYFDNDNLYVRLDKEEYEYVIGILEKYYTLSE